MSDDTPGTPPPEAAGGGGPQEAESPMTTLLRSDAVSLMLAARAVDKGGGTPEAVIAARMDLDRELRERLAWPSGRDYARAAEEYERAGRPGDAALLRRMADADTLIAAAKAEWNARYDARQATPAEKMVYTMRQAGVIDFDPAGPYPGVDGAAYEPGAIDRGGEAEPILVVSGRGAAELVVGWPGFDAMAEWVATRGTTASGPLTPPPASGACRAWEEDQLLARLVTSPRDAPRFTAALPPATFTTDVRYDLYQSIAALARDDCYYFPYQLEAELGTRMAMVPPHRAADYGGAAGPFARAYLARLSATEVSRETAAAIATALVREDARPAQAVARAQTTTAGEDNRPGVAPSAGPPLLQPRPQQDPGPGAVPRL